MFKLAMAILVEDPPGNFRSFRRDVDLPFVPTEGLVIDLGDDKDGDGIEHTCTDLSYQVEKERFASMETGHPEDIDLILSWGFVEEMVQQTQAAS